MSCNHPINTILVYFYPKSQNEISSIYAWDNIDDYLGFRTGFQNGKLGNDHGTGH